MRLPHMLFVRLRIGVEIGVMKFFFFYSILRVIKKIERRIYQRSCYFYRVEMCVLISPGIGNQKLIFRLCVNISTYLLAIIFESKFIFFLPFSFLCIFEREYMMVHDQLI